VNDPSAASASGSPTPDSTDDTPTNAVGSIDFYWRPGCGFCSRLHRRLDGRVTLTMHNIWEDPDAAAVVRSVARGNETVPTVGIGGTYLVNPSADEVLELTRRAAPGAIPRDDPAG